MANEPLRGKNLQFLNIEVIYWMGFKQKEKK